MADLRSTLLLDEIRELKRRLWSGVVALADGDVRKGIYLRAGRFVFAASTVEEDKLGEHLVRTGRVTAEQFEAALRAAQGPGRRLGQALVETGAVAEADLEGLVAEQVRSIALSVFRWTSGEVRYQQVDEPVPSDLALPLSTERLLLEGARIFPDAARLEAGLGDLGRRLRRVTRLPFDYGSIPAAPSETHVLDKVGSGIKVEELFALPLPRPVVARAVYALLAGEMLEEAVGRTSPTPQPAFIPTPAFGLQAPPLSPETVERQARDCLDKGDRARAIALLRQEVERNPRAQPCRRLLAMTLASDAGFSPELEKLFLSTLETNPRDVELRHRFAAWYKRVGLGARAILQLKLVVGTDPSHAAAWRDLAELEAAEGGPGRR